MSQNISGPRNHQVTPGSQVGLFAPHFMAQEIRKPNSPSSYLVLGPTRFSCSETTCKVAEWEARSCNPLTILQAAPLPSERKEFLLSHYRTERSRRARHPSEIPVNICQVLSCLGKLHSGALLASAHLELRAEKGIHVFRGPPRLAKHN